MNKKGKTHKKEKKNQTKQQQQFPGISSMLTLEPDSYKDLGNGGGQEKRVRRN